MIMAENGLSLLNHSEEAVRLRVVAAVPAFFTSIPSLNKSLANRRSLAICELITFFCLLPFAVLGILY